MCEVDIENNERIIHSSTPQIKNISIEAYREMHQRKIRRGGLEKRKQELRSILLEMKELLYDLRTDDSVTKKNTIDRLTKILYGGYEIQ